MSKMNTFFPVIRNWCHSGLSRILLVQKDSLRVVDQTSPIRKIVSNGTSWNDIYTNIKLRR
jgi:hypothetical protein